MIRALGQHLLLSLRLNFRSRQPLVYGYIVPVFFLLAFGSVFRSGDPPLLAQMGQLLTITVLGGACFGMPTSIVNERERGVWRRYRLLPTASGGLLLSAMVSRFVLVFSAALLQLGLAWCFYRTPMPAIPAQLMVAFSAVCFAFLGLGLIVAMLADTVPAVQALGQVIFLPMIMIGGVGVPLRNLPPWAQYTAGFFPGKYAVEAMQACIVPKGAGVAGTKFALVALCLIGIAGCVASAGLFRWESGQRLRLDRTRIIWLGFAVATCLAVGICANAVRPGAQKPSVIPVAHETPSTTLATLVTPIAEPAATPLAGWRGVADAEITKISFDELPPDDGYVLPIAKDLSQLDEDGKTHLNHFEDKLAYWAPGKGDDPVQRVRNLLSVCSVADLLQDPSEAEIAYAVFDEIQNNFRPDDLSKMLIWLILHPDQGTIINKIDEFGIDGEPPADQTRDRVVSYAKKLLLRTQGKPPVRRTP